MEGLRKVTETSVILKLWEEKVEVQAEFEPEHYITRLCEIIEGETEEYLKLDPDPFDDRHPSRIYPTCAFGQSLKMIYKKENFMSKLVHEYLRESNGVALNTAACRLFIDILPGVENSVIYQETEGLILKLFNWAENASEPLQSYALGLLGASMDVPDIASKFKDKNVYLVPLMMKRLKDLQIEFLKDDIANLSEIDIGLDLERPFARFASCIKKSTNNPSSTTPNNTMTTSEQLNSIGGGHKRQSLSSSRKRRRGDDDEYPDYANEVIQDVNSSSSWAELESNIIGTWKIYPITLATRQILTLRYLAPLGEYQEMLSFSFEHNSISLIIRYLEKSRDSRLTFEALKYLAALLCHKKFANEFIQANGLQKMLNIPRPSLAATGVSLCLYYVAYAEDGLEKVCMMSKTLLTNLVSYVMWLLECSHTSSRNHALMFFSTVYPFRLMLDLFDSQEGLRRVLNVISTQKNFFSDATDNDDDSRNDEDQIISRQAVRQVAYNLKRYFETHLAFLAEKLKRMEDLNSPNIVHSPTPPYKPVHIDSTAQQKIVLDLKPYSARWNPVETFIKYNGVHTLMQVISMAYDWSYPGRSETVRSVLEILAICVLEPKVQLTLTEQVTLNGSNNLAYGLILILSAAEGEVVQDPDVQRSALQVIGNCVCGPLKVETGQNLLDKSLIINTPGSKSKSLKPKSSEELLNKMWECVRVNNGILILTRLLMVKTPLTDADALRALACWCLAGLARYKVTMQVLEQLPLIRNGILNQLMREPILQEKRQYHVLFHKYASEIIKLVYGAKAEVDTISIQKSDLISQTRISYNEAELLELIQEYLTNKGFTNTAQVLSLESAGFENKQQCQQQKQQLLTNPAVQQQQMQMSNHLTPTKNNIKKFILSSSTSNNNSPKITPAEKQQNINTTTTTGSLSSPQQQDELIATNNLKSRALMPPPSSILTNINCPQQPGSSKNLILNQQPRILEKVTLDRIIKEYLMNQHSMCKTPMATCPEFTLRKPHKCPAPRDKITYDCFPSRLGRLQIQGKRDVLLERKLIYSRFKPFRVVRAEAENAFSSCAYSPCYQWIMVGTAQGEVKLFNNGTGNEDGSYQCHDSEVYHLQPNSKGSLLLTSSTWRRPLSALWRMDSLFDRLIDFQNDEYVEFSKVNQEKIVATHMEHCSIYDVETHKRISSFEPRMSNQYMKNRATFCPNDDLILSDGILWDVRAGTEIHKFDKLNENINGVFHPTGLEIISSSEVWDVRTWRLIKTVKALDQSHVTFTNDGSVIYGIKIDRDTPEGFKGSDTSFVTLDATSYSSIGTIELKKSILGLATSPNDLQIALVESQPNDIANGDSVVRFYEVGRTRNQEDEGEEEEEEEMEEEDASDDDDDDADDDNEEDNDLDRLLDEILPNGVFEENGGDEAEDSGSDPSDSSDSSESENDSDFGPHEVIFDGSDDIWG